MLVNFLCKFNFLSLKLFSAWFLLSSLGSALYWSLFQPSSYSQKSSVTVPPIVESPKRDINTHQEFRNDLNTDEIVEKILQNPKIYNIINNYDNDVQINKESNENLQQLIQDLKNEISKIKNDLVVLEESKKLDLDRAISQIRGENVRSFALLTRKINRCCGKQIISLEPHITAIFTNLLNNPDFLSNQKGLNDYLHALFVAKQHLESQLGNLTDHLSFKVDIDSTTDKVMEKVVSRLSERPLDSTITDEQIKKVVQSALKIYDADKTGLVDYAMEPLGGEIVTTRCTESYNAGTAVISVLGVPVWYPSVSPRVVITPGVNPGECWSFQNFPGFLVIKLATTIKIEAFSVEHVSRLLVPDGRIDSAPKEFEVYGLRSENDKESVKIGEYVFDYDGDSIQYFIAQTPDLKFNMVELRIKSNHGNPNYTCLYRFRVHGKVDHDHGPS